MSSDSSVKSLNDVDVRHCKFDWAIRYEQYRYQPVSSPIFYDKCNSFHWHLRFKPSGIGYGYGNAGTKGEINLMITNVASNQHDIRNHGAYGGQVVLFIKSENKKLTVKGTLKTWIVGTQHYVDNSAVYTLAFEKEERGFSWKNDFSVKCDITYFPLNDLIPLFISEFQCPVIPFEVNVSNPLEDFGKFYLKEEHSDIVICIKGGNKKCKKYPAHKLVLTARSSVFEAMFRHDMEEKTLNRIVVEDIEENVFLEALRYMYTGNVQNLDTLVYDLLPVADKYDLEKLRVMCGNIIRKKLSVETALKIVCLADLYNVGDLKNTATQFIRDHSADVVKKMDSKAWQNLMSKPHLMKDLLIVNMNK